MRLWRGPRGQEKANGVVVEDLDHRPAVACHQEGQEGEECGHEANVLSGQEEPQGSKHSDADLACGDAETGRLEEGRWRRENFYCE